jgi:hypothetical protein
MALAFGLSAEEAGLGSEIVSSAAALAKIGMEAPKPEAKPKRPDKQALPMPTMPDQEG